MMRQNLVLVGLLRLPLVLLRLPLTMLKRAWGFLDDRAGISPILLHPVPQERGLIAWMYVDGTAVLFSFLVAVVTGIPIASIYVPSSGQAYQSLQYLDNQAILGRELRGLHLISATAMFVLMGLHMTRVFLTGSFKYPRELNWLTGTLLFICTFLLLFTGQILRWDNFGLWTLAITASMAARTPIIGQPLAYFLDGGYTWGGQTLPRLFTFHVFLLPGLLFAVVGLHLYLVLKEGISESPRAGRPVDRTRYRAWYQDLLKREGVPFWPDAGWRDAVFGAFVVFAIIAIALWFGPIRLGAPPDPTNVVVQPRPDWYFIWYYAALALVPYNIENYVIIGAPVIFLGIMFALPFIANGGERAPSRRPWAIASVVLGALMIASLIETGDLAPWSPRFETASLPLPAKITTGLSGPALQGAKLWRAYGCPYCHMISGYGGIRGPDLTNIGNELTPDQITIRIANGGYNMPQYGGLMPPDQLNDLVAFLQTRRAYAVANGVSRQKLSGGAGGRGP